MAVQKGIKNRLEMLVLVNQQKKSNKAGKTALAEFIAIIGSQVPAIRELMYRSEEKWKELQLHYRCKRHS